MRCSAVTKHQRPCRLDADRCEADGRWVCHIHHSEGLYQLQVKANREDRAARKAARLAQTPLPLPLVRP